MIFISSIGGLHPIPMIGPYSVSKTALLGLTKALSFELAPMNVRVNCVAPGIVKTKFASAVSTRLIGPFHGLARDAPCSAVFSKTLVFASP